MNTEPGTDERDAGPLTVACHVRAPMLMEPIDSHVETLSACEAEGTIDELLLRSWPDHVNRSGDGPNREVIDRFEAYEAWARRRGVSVRPPFEVREHTSTVTGEYHERLVTPLISLALYEDGQLFGVFPHSADGETYTVEDAIATLRTGEVPTPLTGDVERVVDPDRCPACEGRLVNGQGLFACGACGWSGISTVDADYGHAGADRGETPGGDAGERERVDEDGRDDATRVERGTVEH